MITVVAALIWRGDRILICQRSRNDSFALKWEFPGGKVKPGETAEQALARELQEELGVAATVGPLAYQLRHRYQEHSHEIALQFYFAAIGDAEVRNLTFEKIAWEVPAKLPAYDFLAADRELVKKLSQGELASP